MTDPQSSAPQTPVPVEIAGPSPVPVEIVAGDPREGEQRMKSPPSPSMRVQSQRADPSLPANTTFQEDLTTAGQRRINLIWEYTQAAIALCVVLFSMGASVVAMVYGKEIPSIIGVAFGMVTGFYFARTNHERIGGLGAKASKTYEGR